MAGALLADRGLDPPALLADSGLRIEPPLIRCNGEEVALADLVGVTSDGDLLVLHAAPVSAADGCFGTGEARRRLKRLCVRFESAAQAKGAAEDVSRAAGLPPCGSHRFLVLINPRSGSQHGATVWEEVRPMFEASGAVLDVRTTASAGEAGRIAAALDISTLDAIVCVSGDGLLNEVVNGLMSRPDADAAIGAIQLAAVPAGSGNSLATSILKASGEPLHPTSSAFLICRGPTCGQPPSPPPRVQSWRGDGGAGLGR